MNFSSLISKSLATLSVATAPIVFASTVSAGPGLYYHYDYLNLDTTECLSSGYRALGNRYLQIPSNITDNASFAIGESPSVTVIIDCSEASQTGRVTVMASSNDPTVADNYAQDILRDISH